MPESSPRAPVALFAFRRPRIVRQTLDALSRNHSACETDLWVFSDGPKSSADIPEIEEVRELISTLSGFRNVVPRFSSVNLGLASSITTGVSELADKYGRVIVVEDDIVTAPAFLDYMNLALKNYEPSKNVWHINGYSFPAGFQAGRCFFTRVMNCWGWATWADRWKNFERSPEQLLANWNADRISRLNVDNTIDYWEQVGRNATGDIKTWAIFWHALISEHHGLCLMPPVSFVRNIGFDGSGENCDSFEGYDVPHLANTIPAFPEDISEDAHCLHQLKKYLKSLKPSFAKRIVRRLKKLTALRHSALFP